MCCLIFMFIPKLSTRAAEYDLGVSRSTVPKMLAKHDMHPYKFNIFHSLHSGDASQRGKLSEMIVLRTQEAPTFLCTIIWPGELKITHDGIFNRHNSLFWATENSHIIREGNFQTRFSVNVFALIMHGQVRYHIYEGVLNSEICLAISQTIVTAFVCVEM